METTPSSKRQGRQQAPPTILLCVTGSIAAYKAVEVLRLLVKSGEDVQVVMTSGATHFVGPLTFQALSGHPVFSDPLDPGAYQMAHLTLPETASSIVVAPASAESLSQMARGGAHDPVSACVLSAPRASNGTLKVPVFIAPAMHESMWLHPATQANVKTLKDYGYQFIGPEKGDLGRSGDAGLGRMADPQKIVTELVKRRAR